MMEGTTKKYKKSEKKLNPIYSLSTLTRNIAIHNTLVGKNIDETIENYISLNYQGKCLSEGFIKKDSIKIITYSSGLVQGSNIIFSVVFQCFICFPVEGMHISCKAINITKAGIRAESADEFPSPIVVFIARDHNYLSQSFLNIQEGDILTCKVIGQRFELNDTYVSIIGEIVVQKTIEKPKPYLIIEN